MKNIRDEVPVQHRDGHEVPVIFSATPMRANGKIVGLTGILRDITEQKRVENALRESEERFRGVLENSVDVVFQVNLKTGTFNYISPSLKKMSGFSPEEMLALGYEEIIVSLVHPDDRATVEEDYRKLREHSVEKGALPVLEGRIRHKELGYRWISITRTIDFDDKNIPIAMNCSIRDVTERKRAEEEIQSLARFPSENPNPVLRVAKDGKVLYSNKAALELLAKWETKIGEKAPGRWRRLIEEAIESGKPRSEEEEVKDRIFSFEIGLIKESGYVNLYGYDITERKRAEEALRESEEKFRAVFMQSPIGVEFFNSQGKDLILNPACLEIFGVIDPSEAKPLALFDSPFVPQPAKDRLMKGELVRFEVPYDFETVKMTKRYRTSKSGVIYLEVSISPVRLAEGIDRIGHYLVQVQDITERKKAEVALRESEEKWRSLTENSPDHIMLLDLDFNILFINRTVLDLTKEEVIGTPAFKYIPPEYHQSTADCYKRVAASGKPDMYTTIYRTKEGESQWFEVRIGPVLKNGQVVAFTSSSTDITERRRMEEELAGSEAKYRSLIETAGAGVANIDLRGDFVLVNEALCRMIGYSREELLGRNFADFLHPDDKKEVLEIFVKGLAGERQQSHLEFRVIHKDGNSVWCYSSPTPIVQGDEMTGFSAIIRDITERKGAEEALHFTRFAIDNAVDEMVCVSQDARYIDVNDAFCRAVGYSREELLSMTVHDIDPNYSAKIWPEFWEKLKRSGSLTFESCHRTKDGKVFPVEVTVTFFEYKGKEYHCGFARDITERKKAEEALHESEARFRNLVELAPDAIMTMDLDGIVTSWNSSAERLTGYSADEIIGKHFSDFETVPPEDAPGYLKIFESLLRGQVPETFEAAMLYKDGTHRLVDVRVGLIEKGGKYVGLQVISRDITERKQAEEALRLSEEKYRMVVENANEVIAVAQDGKLRFFNSRMAELLGYSREELTSRPFFEFVHPDDRDMIMTRYLKRIEGEGVPGVYSFRVVDKEGKTDWVEINAVTLTWEGRPATLNFFSNITERKKAEDMLKESGEKYRNLFNNARVGLFRSRIADGKILECNDLLATMFGYRSREECIAEHVTSEGYVDSNARALELKQLSESGQVKDFEALVARKDGSPFWISYSATIYPENDCIEGVVIDITERKRMEEELRRSEHEKALVLDNAGEIIAYYDTDHNIQWANKAYLKATGLSLPQIRGQKCYQAWGLNKLCENCPVTKVIEIGEPQEGELAPQNQEHWPSDKGCWLSRAAPVKDDTGTIIGAIEIAYDITERKKAEEALKESEERYKALVENSYDVINVIRRDGTIAYRSPASAYVPGLKIEDFTGMSGFDWVHPDDVSKCMDAFAELMEKPGAVANIELRTKYIDDSWHTVEANASNLLDNKAVQGIVIHWHDITERKKAEEELRRLSDAVRMSTDSIVVTDMEGNILDGNEASVRMYGAVDRADLFETKAFDIIAPEDREKASEKMKEVMEKGYVSGLEHHVLTRDGRKILVEASTAIMRGSKGEPVGFVGVSRDITERKRAEEELGKYQRHLEELVGERTASLEDANERLQCEIAERQQAEEALRASEERFRNIVESIPIPVVISRMSDGATLYGNRQFVLTTGLSLEELTGRKIWDFYDSPTERKDVLNHLLREAHIAEREFQGKRADGTTFWAMASVRLLKFEGDDAVLTAFHDITARKKAEEERENLYQRERNLRRQLEEEMKKRVEFTRTLAHELKTPLTPVMLSSQELVAMLKDETSLRLAKNISRGASNLSSRIDELLDLAKGEIGMLKLKREYIDVVKLLQEVVEEVSTVPGAVGRN